MKKLHWWILFAFGAVAVCVAFHFDAAVQNWVATHPNRSARIFMTDVSRFGDWPEHVGLGLLLVAIACWRRSEKWKRVFFAMLLACAIAGVLSRGIKIGTGRARPSLQTAMNWNGPHLGSKYNAFPSGHTASSTAFFVTLFLVSWRLGLAFSPIPLFIAVSRIYVAAHYLSDVTFAIFLGILCALIAWRSSEWVEKREAPAVE